jgi:hypothetical protein
MLTAEAYVDIKGSTVLKTAENAERVLFPNMSVPSCLRLEDEKTEAKDLLGSKKPLMLHDE